MDIFPPAKQRPALLAFAEACGTRPSALSRDECGDWAIHGTKGHIYAVPEGYQFVIGTAIEELDRSSRKWTADKSKLSFCKLTQDGDYDGCMILDRFPSKAEGAAIRSVLGIPKGIELSEGQLAALRAHAAKYAFQPGPAAKTPSDVRPGIPDSEAAE